MENTGKTRVSADIFPNITTSYELRTYLDDSEKRLKNSPFVHHYTTLDNVVKMIRGGSWHLGNAAGMNDKLEYENGDLKRWNNLFFSCFMCEDKESIGMWSMYAQPWERGVKITLPSNAVRKWIRSTKELLEISTDDYQPTGKIIPLGDNTARLRLSAVAYSNADSLQKNSEEKITWSNKSNKNIRNAAHISELTGYIKDMAWSYEKEIRIKAEFQRAGSIERVAIPLNDEIISQMIITASPLFDGNLQAELQKSIESQLKNNGARITLIRTDSSIFTHRLNIKTVCQSCKFNPYRTKG